MSDREYILKTIKAYGKEEATDKIMQFIEICKEMAASNARIELLTKKQKENEQH